MGSYLPVICLILLTLGCICQDDINMDSAVINVDVEKNEQTSTIVRLTTTTLPDWECEKNLDCGDDQVIYLCQMGDVYKQTTSNICDNHVCNGKIELDLYDSCKDGEQCTEGEEFCKLIPTTTMPLYVGLEVISVIGENIQKIHAVEEIQVLVRLQAGSDELNLVDTVILLDTTSTSQSIKYGGVGTSSTPTLFQAEYIKKGPEYSVDSLNRGDIIRLLFTPKDPIKEAKKARIKIIPRVGDPATIEFTTPDDLRDDRITLWP